MIRQLKLDGARFLSYIYVKLDFQKEVIPDVAVWMGQMSAKQCQHSLLFHPILFCT